MESEIKEVVIPACEEHQGLYAIKVKLHWVCPVCKKERVCAWKECYYKIILFLHL